MPQFGAHMSIAGGLHTCLERGAAHGCDVVQLFTKSNQQWQAKPILRGDLDRWREQRANMDVEPALVHDSYLINLASPDPSLWRRSVRAFADEYARCGLLGVPALVFHPGAHVGSGATAGIARVAKAINRVCDEQTENPTRLLLENTAGQGTSLGWRLEELRDILAAVAAPDRVGVCVDTCHIFAAGYELRTAAGWHETLAAIERTVGLDRVRAFHVNDSKNPRGSRVDRHEHIGRGTIGLSGFRRLVNEQRFHDKPMVLETPKPTDWADRINLAVLRSLTGRSRVTAVAQRLARQSLQQPPESDRRSASGALSARG